MWQSGYQRTNRLGKLSAHFFWHIVSYHHEHESTDLPVHMAQNWPWTNPIGMALKDLVQLTLSPKRRVSIRAASL